jgi:hypothetical protein
MYAIKKNSCFFNTLFLVGKGLVCCPVCYAAQSRQRTKLSLQSSELGPPLTRRRKCTTPPPLWLGGTHSLTGEGVDCGGGSNSNEGTDTVVL